MSGQREQSVGRLEDKRKKERSSRNRMKFSLIRTAEDDFRVQITKGTYIQSYYRWLLKTDLLLIKLLLLNFLWYGICSLTEQKITKQQLKKKIQNEHYL